MFFLFFFLMIPRPLSSTLFPYTTLFRSVFPVDLNRPRLSTEPQEYLAPSPSFIMTLTTTAAPIVVERFQATAEEESSKDPLDRKSTRLNSSHSSISYAVFCLKKKIVTLN